MNSQTTNLLFIAMMVGAFYLLIIRPQQKRAASQRALIASLEAGDEVVTVGGIYVTVAEVGERLLVRTVDGSEFELAPQAVGHKVRREAPGPDTDGEPEPADEEPHESKESPES